MRFGDIILDTVFNAFGEGYCAQARTTAGVVLQREDLRHHTVMAA